eukprot:c12650_g2_i1 orf=48-644(+)
MPRKSNRSSHRRRSLELRAVRDSLPSFRGDEAVFVEARCEAGEIRIFRPEKYFSGNVDEHVERRGGQAAVSLCVRSTDIQENFSYRRNSSASYSDGSSDSRSRFIGQKKNSSETKWKSSKARESSRSHYRNRRFPTASVGNGSDCKWSVCSGQEAVNVEDAIFTTSKTALDCQIEESRNRLSSFDMGISTLSTTRGTN